MKNFSTFRIRLVGLALAFGLNALAQTPVDPALAQALQQKLDSCLTAFNVPGISCAIILPNGQEWQGTAGLSDINTFESMNTSLLFHQASVTKMYVTAVVMQLVEEGQLSLDDSLGTYLPPFPNINGKIKIRNLLNHRSGIFNYTEYPQFGSFCYFNPEAERTPEEIITSYVQAPYFPENGGFHYSNTNFMLLAMIVEAITGQPIATELRNRFLEPHSLNQTFLPLTDSIAGPKATGWTLGPNPGVYDTDAAPFLTNCFMSQAFAAGALVAQPVEVARFTRLLHGGDLVADSLVAKMQSIIGNNYGLGTMRFTYNGRTYYGHNGQISGFTTLTIYRPQDSVTLSLGINRSQAPHGPIAAALLQVMYTYLTTTGTAEATAAALAMSIRPNPASGRVYVGGTTGSGGDFRVEVLDLSGRRLLEMDVPNVPPGRFEVPVKIDGLGPGLYACRLLNADKIMVKYITIF
ncbi:MAG: serine hydrolase [Saprospiraceae bacterium]|nr:serine hydrolase [Saprospiraceae bacterium]